MNKNKLEVGDLVVYSTTKWREGIGLVVEPHIIELNAWKIYWFKYGSTYTSNEHYLTKLSQTQEETK